MSCCTPSSATEVPATVAIDEREVPAWWRVVDSGLHEGATLAPVPEERRTAPHAPLELVILSGLDAGRAFPLPVGQSTLGRDAGNTIMLARRFGLARATARSSSTRTAAGR